MSFFMQVAKIFARFIYAILKLFPTRNKITMISRFNVETSIDFKMLEEEIKKRNINTKIVILNHKLKTKRHLIIDVLIEMYHISNSKAVIIDSYIIPISILKHKKNLKIIQIWHALGAIKKFGYAALDKKEGASKEIAKVMDMHKNYTYVIVGGEKTIPFYAQAFNIDENILKPYSLPRVDYLKENNVKNESLFKKYPVLNEKKNVLYAPTFRKGSKVHFNNIIEKFDFENYNLIIKKHPMDKTKFKGDERVIYVKDFTIFELLVSCDALITDYSALSLEAAAINKPVYFYLYDLDEYEENRGIFVNLYHYFPKYVSGDITVLLKSMKKKYDYSYLEEYRKDFVNSDDKKSAEKIIDLI